MDRFLVHKTPQEAWDEGRGCTWLRLSTLCVWSTSPGNFAVKVSDGSTGNLLRSSRMCFTVQKRCLHSGQVFETSAHFRMHRTQKLQATTWFSCQRAFYHLARETVIHEKDFAYPSGILLNRRAFLLN